MRAIKRLFCFFGIAVLPVFAVETGVKQIASYQQTHLPKSGTYDGFIVYLKDDFAADDKGVKKATGVVSAAQTMAAAGDIAIKRKISTGGYWVKPILKNVQQNQDIFDALRNNPEVILVEPNWIFRVNVSPDDDPGFADLWGLKNSVYGVNAVSAWDSGHTGEGITVAVIDTGIIDHPDLNANVVPGYDFISDSDMARDGDGRDANPADEGDWYGAYECGIFVPEPANSSWHGSHVAGTIAMIDNAIGGVGVAPDANILPVRVLGKCGGSNVDIAEAIRWAAGLPVDGTSDNAHPAKVINMSLGAGGSCSYTTQSAIDAAVENGASVIVAAGNSNDDTSRYSPSNCANVLSVAALDEEGNRAGFSNYGSTVALSAPGTAIYSTVDTGETVPQGPTYENHRGTSMATPHVAGVAALLLSKEPMLSPREVMARLVSTAKPIAGDCLGGCGAGLVDAGRVLSTVVIQLVKATPKTIPDLNAGESVTYAFFVPKFTSDLKINTYGGTGNANLKVLYDGEALCDLSTGDNNETCNIASPESGIYSILVTASSAVNGASIVADYTEINTVLSKAVARSVPSTKRYEEITYTFEVPPGNAILVVNTYGGTGDIDLKIHFDGTQLCNSAGYDNEETCRIESPQAGTYQILVSSFQASQGVTIVADYAKTNNPVLFSDSFE